jgi:hypothetical protein
LEQISPETIRDGFISKNVINHQQVLCGERLKPFFAKLLQKTQKFWMSNFTIQGQPDMVRNVYAGMD